MQRPYPPPTNPTQKQGKPPVVMRERTTFVRRKDAWFFATGTVTSEEAGFKGQAHTTLW